MNRVETEIIKNYSRQLHLPTFKNYENIIRQLEPGESHSAFLINLMKQELEERSVTGQK